MGRYFAIRAEDKKTQSEAPDFPDASSAGATILLADQESDQVKSLLKSISPGEEISADELMKRLGMRHRPTFRRNYLNPALAAGLMEMTQPDSPRSPTQRYRLTQAGERPRA